MTGTEAFASSCQAILDSPQVDVAILSTVPVTPTLDNLPADPQGGHRENLSSPGSQPARMIEIINGSAKPAVVVVDSGDIYDPMRRMLLEAGIPAVDLIDFEFPEWHTTGDTPDICSAESLRQVGRLITDIVYRPLGGVSAAQH